jgi:UMF1 family MFS transporter
MGLVVLWILLCVVGYLLPKGGIYEFYGLAIAVGFVMGGTQSLSRSTYAKLMPETKDTASFFSFYDVTEKIALFLGLFVFGTIEHITGSIRNSILFLIIFFVLGLISLFNTKRAAPKEKYENLYH